MKRLLIIRSLLIALLTIGISSNPAALAQEQKKETAGIANADSLAAKVDSLFKQWNRPDSPGCSLGVAKQGKTVLTSGYGMANLEYSVPMTPEIVSETGSVAKQFTAAAIVLLAQQGKLSLDDPVRKYLPEVPDFGAPLTIRQLISHLSGLRDQNEFFELMGLPMGRSVHTNDEILEVVTRQKRLNFEPNSEYLYSNTGYTLLVHIVNRVSGKPFAEFTQEHLFHPLGMRNTQWRDDFTKVVKNRATAYEPDGRGGFRMNMPFGNVHGAGGLLTTVKDLLIWNENLENGRVGGSEFIKLMQTRARLKDGNEIDYATGLTVTEYKGVPEISHGGATAGYRTFLARFPEQKLSIALLCNVTNVNSARLARQVADIFLEGHLKENKISPIRVAVSDLENKAGLYRNADSGETLRFFARNGKLFTGFGAGTELIPVGTNKFKPAESVVEYIFEGGQGGEPRRVRRTNGRYPAVVYSATASFNPTPAQLNDYAGNYYSEELNATHSVTIKDGKLKIRVYPQPERDLNPIFEDGFLIGASSGQIKFTRDSAGKVDGFEIYTGRIRHLRFIKR
jgi:CubicO group peptidase (beta-lactamase class C family)/ribosomal protein L25 (general stress protein Ctc)